MVQLCNPDVISTESEVEFNELDYVPLSTRRRLLLSGERVHPRHGVVQSATATASALKIDVVVKREDGCCDSLELSTEQNGHSKVSGGVASESAVSEFSESAELGCCQDIGVSGNRNSNRNIVAGIEPGADSDRLDKFDGSVPLSTQNQPLHVISGKVKIKCLDGNLLGSPGDATDDPSRTGVVAVNPGNFAPTDMADGDIDHIGLKERRLLLRRIPLRLAKPAAEINSISLSEGHAERNAKRIREESPSENGKASIAGSQFSCTIEKKDSVLYKNIHNGSSYGTVTELSSIASKYSTGVRDHLPAKSTKPRVNVERPRQNSIPLHTNYMQSSTSYSSIKVERLDGCVMQKTDRNPSGNLSFGLVQVKREVENAHEINGDELDHMKLIDRMNLPTSPQNFPNSECPRKILPSTPEFSPECAKPVRGHCPKKRKKTATDSIETALEEDAPGLLQVLLKQGISVNEIKLYGETDGDDALDESLTEDSFTELEAVMSKLFFQRESFIKFPQVRSPKGSKPSYCLTCLFALVEQARYLQFRKWPAEWGWCRDLQSFIFIFERHKRIVMERPEYGYATYFFELVDTSPIGWQIKRLVTAMKLTSCGRVTLIENKPLLVGEELTEGEAHVLMEYGWLPNTGLGTMLNYRDRVVHDRRNEKDTSEWRSKICKLLIDGYNDGAMISSSTIVEKGVEFMDTDSPPIKLELV